VELPEPSGTKARAGVYTNSTRAQRVHRWCFTSFHDAWTTDFGLPWNECPPNVQYVCGQPEMSATRRRHFQGYIQVTAPSTLAEMLQLPLFAGTHLEASGATLPSKAIDYTRKAETAIRGPTGESLWKELGKIEHKHVNDQYKDVVELVRGGGTLIDVLTANPGIALRHHGGIEKISQLFMKPTMRDSMTVNVFVGPTSLGKSHTVYQLEPDWNAVFVKLASSNKFWCGYEQQLAIVLDDFRPERVPIEDMLNWLDRMPMSIEVKGSHRRAMWERVYITTNIPVEEWYKKSDVASRQALMRRITNVVPFRRRVADGTYTNVSEFMALQLAPEPPAAIVSDNRDTSRKDMLLLLAEQLKKLMSECA
jgi:hypothetical protein